MKNKLTELQEAQKEILHDAYNATFTDKLDLSCNHVSRFYSDGIHVQADSRNGRILRVSDSRFYTFAEMRRGIGRIFHKYMYGHESLFLYEYMTMDERIAADKCAFDLALIQEKRAWDWGNRKHLFYLEPNDDRTGAFWIADDQPHPDANLVMNERLPIISGDPEFWLDTLKGIDRFNACLMRIPIFPIRTRPESVEKIYGWSHSHDDQ